MKTAAEFAKKTTIGEMINLPNRYSHHFYREAYLLNFKASKNPNGPEAKQLQGEAMASALTGGAV